MFTRSDDKITTSQAVIFLTDSILGAGILTMPRDITEKVQTPDAWLAVLLGGGMVLPILWIMVKLSQQFPGKTIFEYARSIMGKIPGSIVSLLMVIYFLIIAGFEIRMLAEVNIFYLLEGTPVWAVIIPFIWTAAYLASGGINCIARLFQIIFPVSVLILLLSFLLSMKIFDIDNIRPFLGEGLPPVMEGLKSSILIYSGFEIVMVLVGHMEHPEKAVKPMLLGAGSLIILYVLATLIVVGGMSISAVFRSTWPTLDLLRSFEITGLFFERFEFPFLVIWMMQMFCNFCSQFFVTSLGLSKTFGIKFPLVIFALMPVLFIAAMIPRTMNELFALGGAIGNMSALLFVLVTAPLCLIYLIRRKGLRKHA